MDELVVAPEYMLRRGDGPVPCIVAMKRCPSLPLSAVLLLAGCGSAGLVAPGNDETDRVARVVSDAIAWPRQESAMGYARAAADTTAGQDGRLTVVEVTELEADKLTEPRPPSKRKDFLRRKPSVAASTRLIGPRGVALTREQSSGALSTEIEFSSLLNAPAERVWSQVTDFRQINAELMPILRMTVPSGWTDLSLESIRPGQTLFRSWLLLFGVLPIGYDDLSIAEVGPGYRRERFQMMSAATWEHERLVEDAALGKCKITDRVRFTPRWKVSGLVLNWFVPRLFAHRHHKRRGRFSSTGPGSRAPQQRRCSNGPH